MKHHLLKHIQTIAWHLSGIAVLLCVMSLYWHGDFLLLLVNQMMLCGS